LYIKNYIVTVACRLVVVGLQYICVLADKLGMHR